MQPNLLATPEPAGSTEPNGTLRRFLQAYWLRPENAYWMTLRSNALAACKIDSPSLDVSCGDGLFTFLHLGGALDPGFDVFSAVSSLDRVQPEHVDMFDHLDRSYAPPVMAEPCQTIDVGTDVKDSMLYKAKQLPLYQRLIQHDNNIALPFDSDHFETIYCNAAYWVTNIDGFLSELARVARPTAQIVLQVKLESMGEYTLDAHLGQLGEAFLNIIGRGRLACWPSLADRRTWERRFCKAGLTVTNETPFITATHAHVWDVGLRPIAPLLVQMANGLASEKREAIKAEWVDLFETLLMPFCRPDMNLAPEKEDPGEIQYILRKD